MKAQYDETTIEESESGILRIYGRNERAEWEGIGSTSSKAEVLEAWEAPVSSGGLTLGRAVYQLKKIYNEEIEARRS